MTGDIVLAGNSVSFATAFTGIGLSADGSSTWILPRLVGQRRAQELLILNRRLSAEEGLDWGLITRVVSDENLEAETLLTARKLCNGPVGAFGQIKSLLVDPYHRGLEDQMEDELQRIARAGAGLEAEEGISAFLEKRRSDFKAATKRNKSTF